MAFGVDDLIIGVGGLGLKLWGDAKSANQKSEAIEKEAENKRLQAVEVERRSAVRQKLMEREGRDLLSSQTGYYAAAGVEMAGSPLLRLEQTNQEINEEIAEMGRDSRFRASQLRMGADFDMEAAEDVSNSKYLNMASDAADFGYRAYSLVDKNTAKGGRGFGGRTAGYRGD